MGGRCICSGIYVNFSGGCMKRCFGGLIEKYILQSTMIFL